MLIMDIARFITEHRRVVEGAHNKNLQGFIGPKLAKLFHDNKWETCTVKFSYALNQCGANITKDNPSLLARKRYLTDEQGNLYLISVPDMAEYLKKKYQPADTIPSTRAKAELLGRWGLITYGDRHIDIWKSTKHNSGPYVFDLLEPKYHSEIPRVRFWETTKPSNPGL